MATFDVVDRARRLVEALEKIAKLNKALTELKRVASGLEGELHGYLQESNRDSQSLPDGHVIEVDEGQTTERVSEDFIERALCKLLGPARGKQVTEEMYKMRTVSTTRRFRLKRPRVGDSTNTSP